MLLKEKLNFNRARTSSILSFISLLCVIFFFVTLYLFLNYGKIQDNKEETTKLISSLSSFIFFFPSLMFYVPFMFLTFGFVLTVESKYKILISLITLIFPFLYFLISLILWKWIFIYEELKFNNICRTKKLSIISLVSLIIFLISVIVNSIFEIPNLSNISTYSTFNFISGILVIISMIVYVSIYIQMVFDAKIMDKKIYGKTKIWSYIPILNSFVWIIIKN